jgi:hypothetical protein
LAHSALGQRSNFGRLRFSRKDFAAAGVSWDSARLARPLAVVPDENPEERTMKKLLLAAILSSALAGPAFAHQCPSLMAKIDEAMTTTTVDDATKAQVMDLYAKGKAEHEAGQHDESEADLMAAMKLLGI